jgi:hypothetical protein
MSHSGVIGPPLPAAIVRAALAVRLNGIKISLTQVSTLPGDSRPASGRRIEGLDEMAAAAAQPAR